MYRLNPLSPFTMNKNFFKTSLLLSAAALALSSCHHVSLHHGVHSYRANPHPVVLHRPAVSKPAAPKPAPMASNKPNDPGRRPAARRV